MPRTRYINLWEIEMDFFDLVEGMIPYRSSSEGSVVHIRYFKSYYPLLKTSNSTCDYMKYF